VQVIQACHVDNGTMLMRSRPEDVGKVYYLSDRSLGGAKKVSLSAIAPLESRTLYFLSREGQRVEVTVKANQVLLFSTKMMHSGAEGPLSTGCNAREVEGDCRLDGDPSVFCYLDTMDNPHDLASQWFANVQFQGKFWLSDNLDSDHYGADFIEVTDRAKPTARTGGKSMSRAPPPSIQRKGKRSAVADTGGDDAHAEGGARSKRPRKATYSSDDFILYNESARSF
jgi:hypothetical protein